MTEQELIEALSDKEHAGWARWMLYLFSKCDKREDGSVVIPASLVNRWTRQAATNYADLSEGEKQSDRNQVHLILPIIRSFAGLPTE
jgi:hypothetical protein